MSTKKWWSEGVQFECQGSGNCCVSHGQYGFVYVTNEDRKALAQQVGLSTKDFTKKFCNKTDDFYHLKDNGEDCIFLKNKRCTVYKSRPTQCRTWPFWPETMSAKAWRKDVVGFCPGVGKGKVWSAEQIQKNLDEQLQWEEKLALQAGKR
jgi:Fe-S-cluster containining protein